MEIWRDVVGYEGFYAVSNYGNVKSIERVVTRSDGIKIKVKEKILSKTMDSDGYLNCKLSRDGVSKTCRIHRLVADAFIPNTKSLPEVNHKDCNRANNSVCNLEWIDHGDNVRYSIVSGNHICTTDLHGPKNPNYNNHILHDKYSNNPGLAKIKLSRPRAQNGRATKIRLVNKNGLPDIVFPYIGACAEYLIAIGATTASVDTIRNRITCAAKSCKPYLGYYFEKI